MRLFSFAVAIALASTAAQAGDSNPPVITHQAPKPALPIKITAHITDDSRIFPQVFFRFGTAGNYEPPLDLKKVRGQKDEYEATLPGKAGQVDYYIECYDEFGNGPARAGAPEAPLHIVLDLHAELPISTAITPPSLDDKIVPAKSAAVQSAPAPTPSSPPAPMAVQSNSDPKPQPLPAQPIALRYEPPAPITAGGAAFRSALLPGFGQYRDERRIRGLAFGVATGASLVATVLLQIRYHQANTIYETAPLSVRGQAYDQALNYAHARNSMLGVTIGLYALNVAEAYFLHGTKDPW
jgi:hypothetical protein